MTIRWRLAIFLVELLVIVVGSRLLTGAFFSGATWYSSLFAIPINVQLLEPFFPRPVDVLANSIVGLAFFAMAPTDVTRPGWTFLALALGFGVLLSAMAVFIGANRTEGRW